MRKKTFQITIPEPCDQKWEDMTPESKGRFCGQCTKTIVDFSQKSDRQIALALKESNGQLCGRFSDDQLNRDITLVTALKHNSRWKATGLMLSAMLTMSACNHESNRTMGDIVPVEQFENQEDDKQTPIEQTTSEETIIDIEEIDYDDMNLVLGMVGSPQPPPSKGMLLLATIVILGGIFLFILVLEMIVRATM